MKHLLTFVFFSNIVFCISCNQPPTPNLENQDNKKVDSTLAIDTTMKESENLSQQKETDSLGFQHQFVEAFLTNIKNGNSVDTFMAENWTFTYSSWDRCTGSIDGKKEGLKPKAIGKKINLKVNQKKNGWENVCDVPTITDVSFLLDTDRAAFFWGIIEDYPLQVSKNNPFCFSIVDHSDGLLLCLTKTKPYKIIKLGYEISDPG